MKIEPATRAKIITPTGFKNYDVGANTYVGCQFGCTYCFVRFFVKDEVPWGEFVRLRDFLTTKLPKEIEKLPGGQRLVIGTMTDPYQPVERKHRLTRQMLEIVAKSCKFKKVGIFTRSPFILDDLELIKSLPNPRVHFTVTPFEESVLKKIEPVAIPIEKRLEVIKKIQEAGIRLHTNISPILPIFSEPYLGGIIQTFSQIGVDEFYIDPMQPYRESIEAMNASFGEDPAWLQVRNIITNPEAYANWKAENCKLCCELWKKYDNQRTFAIWQDHQTKFTIDMRTGAELDRKHYGEDSEEKKE